MAKKILIIAVLAAIAAGCDKPVIPGVDHISVQVSDNLESVTASIVFNQGVQSPLLGRFPVAQYGSIFANPTTNDRPFEIGFDLKTAVFSDAHVVTITPDETLPNGSPNGLEVDGRGRALAKIAAPNPISQNFDLVGYVDILHRDWLGGGLVSTNQGHPLFGDGTWISFIADKDSAGNPTVLAYLFGGVDSGKPTWRPGGAAVFVKVSAWLGQHPGAKQMTYPVTLGAIPESALEALR